MPADIVVASWNVHSGVDGWGRQFDVVAACRSIDADVLVLQETWSSDGGHRLACQVGEALGYHVEESPIARAVMFAPPRDAGRKWGPPPWERALHGPRVDRRSVRQGHALDGRRTSEARVSAEHRAQPGRACHELDPRDAYALDEALKTNTTRREHGRRDLGRGTVGLAVLSRLEVGHVETWDLGQMCRDPTRRSAIAVEVVTGEPDAAQRRRMLVVGTHLSHLRQGSRIQLARLRQMLASRNGPVVPAVLAGDMNLPGPPLLAFLPGWKRAVRGRTWPAWCPVAQSDHILFTAAVTGTGEVLPIRGSDHLPVRARLSFT